MLVNKKLLYIIGGVLGGFMLLIVIIALIAGGRVLPYNRIEDLLERAALNYYADNKEQFDVANGTVITLGMSHLEGDYIKPLETMVAEGVYCNGSVKISWVNNKFAVFSYLDCGSDYQTKSLASAIMEREEIVTEGPGLYKMGEKIVYRGSRVNNYLVFDNKTWRILEIDEENNIKIVETETKTRRIWDSRLNPDERGRAGVNEFSDYQTEHSSMRYYLEGLAEGREYVSDNLWGYLAYMDLCVGKRGIDSTGKDGKEECQKVAENHLVGLLTAHEFLRVSLDEACLKTTSSYCRNFNYLRTLPASWLLTAVDGSTNEAYYITPNRVSDSPVSKVRRVIRVITLNPHVIYESGNGTSSNPYIIN